MAEAMEVRRCSGWKGLEASRIVGWSLQVAERKAGGCGGASKLECYDDDVMAVGAIKCLSSPVILVVAAL